MKTLYGDENDDVSNDDKVKYLECDQLIPQNLPRYCQALLFPPQDSLLKIQFLWNIMVFAFFPIRLFMYLSLSLFPYLSGV